MNETVENMEFDLQARVDALQRGECAEEHFLQEILSQRESTPNLVWATLAIVDQRYRRGHLTSELFRSINSKLARHALEDSEYGATVDLHPANGITRAANEQIGRTGGAAATHAPMRAEIRVKPVEPVRRVAEDAAASAEAPIESSMESAEVYPDGAALGSGRLLNGRYSLECVLGRGGMGTVFKALDQQRADLPEANRHVALKILNENVRRRPEILADLRREFYCAQSLAHPNIVKVYEMHHDDDVAFYTMELLEGQLLSDLLQQAQPLPLKDHTHGRSFVTSARL